MASPGLVSRRLQLGDKIRIGRNAACEVAIKCPFISGFHCLVEVKVSSPPDSSSDSNHELHCTLQDLSSNGTWVLKGAPDNENSQANKLDRKQLKLAKKLTKASHEIMGPGDCILLLAPMHKQCSQYIFALAVSEENRHEFILKQLHHTHSDTANSMSSTATPTVKTNSPPLDRSSQVALELSSPDKGSGVKRKSPVAPADGGLKRSKLKGMNSVGAAKSSGFDYKVPEEDKGKEKESKEEMERCPTCWKLFPVTELPLHCPICQESRKITTHPDVIHIVSSPPRAKKLDKDSVIVIRDSPEAKKPRIDGACGSSVASSSSQSLDLAMEQCPKCSEIFTLEELFIHVETCPTPSSVLATDGASLSSLTRELSKEQCPTCRMWFSVTTLISHCESCRVAPSSSGGMDSHCDEVVETDSVSPRRYTLEAFERDGSSGAMVTASAKGEGVSKRSSTSPEVKSKGAAARGGASVAAAVDLEQCVHCLQDFPVTELVTHSAVCPGKDASESAVLEHCQHCLKVFPLNGLVEHALNCSQRKDFGSLESEMEDGVVGDEDVWGEPVERCMSCFKDFPLSKLVVHSSKCTGDMLGSKERFKNFLPSVHDLDAVSLSVLNDMQMSAVEYVMEKSKEASERVYHSLKDKVTALGYTERDLEKTLQWIRQDAPIIIHVNLDRALRYLVEDTHYRNLFETGTGGGCLDRSARSSWEDRIFNKIYSRSDPVDRVKYGVLNIVGDPRGVRSCYGYGDSFLQLKKVRLRTTFASADTSSSIVKLSCCEHYGNVLHEYNSSELKAILDVATRKKAFLRSDMISTYKEVQIHGPVCLSENVDCIVVNERHGADTEMRSLLDKFVENNKCNLIWMEAESSIDYPSFTPITGPIYPSHSTFATAVPSFPTIPPPLPRPRGRRRRRRRRRGYGDY